MGDPTDGSLLILWTSGERATALDMVFMYARNAGRHGWWDEVTLLAWGASQSLLASDPEVQAGVAELRRAGVRVTACRACAEDLGVSQKLAELGCEVFYSGEFLTDWLRSGRRVLSV